MKAKILLLVAIVSVFILLGNWGLEKQARYECQKLERQAESYPGFYRTEAEIEMCGKIAEKELELSNLTKEKARKR